MGDWRVGSHYGIHVYEGDQPVATFHRADDAAQAVTDHNHTAAAEARATAAEERIEAVRALAQQWSEQSTDYDEDTEQQIDDGRNILAALGPSTAPRHRWDHATLDELVRRRDTFVQSWGEVVDDMKAETTAPGADG